VPTPKSRARKLQESLSPSHRRLREKQERLRKYSNLNKVDEKVKQDIVARHKREAEAKVAAREAADMGAEEAGQHARHFHLVAQEGAFFMQARAGAGGPARVSLPRRASRGGAPPPRHVLDARRGETEFDTARRDTRRCAKRRRTPSCSARASSTTPAITW